MLIMARAAQLCKEKSIIQSLRHGGQLIWKFSMTWKASSSAVTKSIKHYIKTGFHKDHPIKGRTRVTSATESKFIRGTKLWSFLLTVPQFRAHTNTSQSSTSKLLTKQKVLQRLKFKIHFDLFTLYCLLPNVLFHDFDVFSINLQSRK